MSQSQRKKNDTERLTSSATLLIDRYSEGQLGEVDDVIKYVDVKDAVEPIEKITRKNKRAKVVVGAMGLVAIGALSLSTELDSPNERATAVYAALAIGGAALVGAGANLVSTRNDLRDAPQLTEAILHEAYISLHDPMDLADEMISQLFHRQLVRARQPRFGARQPQYREL